MGLENTRYVTQKSRFWFALDNAAKIFPAIINTEVTSVIRLSAVLHAPVRIEAFRRAVLKAEKRFPYYLVQLRKGFFWYYLEHLPHHIAVEVDDKRPSRKFSKGGLLLRFLVWNNKISLEVSHILTDGGGAFEFLKTVLILYSQECGKEVPDDFAFKRPDEPFSDEEYEDAYKRYFREDVPPVVKRSKAFHLPFHLNSKPRFRQTNVVISMSDIKQVAKMKGVSITVYLVSVYLFILQDIYENLSALTRLKMNKILRVQVPVNLRNIFSSGTMRNFSLFVMPEIDLRLGHYNFEEILKTTYHQMQLETEKKLINKNISRNVGSEKKIYVRSIPLFLKSLILRIKFNSLGTSQYSGVVTNLGKVKLTPGANSMINYFVLTAPPPNKMLKISCAGIGFGDKLVLSFGNVTATEEFENKFLDFLEMQKISFNRESDL
ncbi:hypothetical protein [Marinilabilia rubra]|uniref:Alcohol acetyltransferase n=1 Tax=Marinilabilia rubra TaxID=2162893 RepID=A0A2U2B8N7_9BACT|nr:hypothetical protein [Marinilabilia rubra]PWD99451.1 hypothetical protein DDZ16_10615 [Marinilabilia rubra]